MCRSQCLLLLVGLTVAAAQSWDIAVTTGDQIQFYPNQNNTPHVSAQLKDLTAIAYDAVHNMLLFVDKQSDNASIFSFHLATNKYQSLVRKRPTENIQGIAFDPVTSLLFWTNTIERSIFSMSLKPESENDLYGNLLLKMEDEIPRGIAVDSCRGYIYWTNTNIKGPTIERAKFDGSEKEVIIDTNIYMPVSIVVDQRTQKLYWVDDEEGIHFSIQSSDLNGKNRKTLLQSQHHVPNALTVSKDSIYWVDWAYRAIWRIPKNSTNYELTKEHVSFRELIPYGIVANYKIEDQTENAPECEALRNLTMNRTSIDDKFSLPPDMGLFCVHGSKVQGKLLCNCSVGYTGERCDISVCRNYCFHGDCSIIADGEPKCKCKDGYRGERCETNVCYGFCLHGLCSLDEEGQPICRCLADYEGSRCETLIPVSTTTTTPEPTKQQQTTINNEDSALNPTCNCSSTNNDTIFSQYASNGMGPNGDLYCNDIWITVRDSVIAVLVVALVAMFVGCYILFYKLKQLKKRPRIKKRIIVNKNVTPMTSRPDQCEITIENCCNMNICETPCFEPRSTIRPTLLNSKPGKEEKRNLIANMDCSDNY